MHLYQGILFNDVFVSQTIITLSRYYSVGIFENNNILLNSNRFNEQVTGYDKQGNILGLSHYGQTGHRRME